MARAKIRPSRNAGGATEKRERQQGLSMSHHHRLRWVIGALIALSFGARAHAQAQGQDPKDKRTPTMVLSNWKWYTDTGWRYLYRGQYARAEQRFNLAIKTIMPYRESSERLLARSYCDLARVLYHEGRFAEAEPLAQWALSVREADTKGPLDAVFQSLFTLALIHSAQHHESKAVPLLKQALALQEANLGTEPDHVNLADTIEELAKAYSALARYPDAEPLYRRAVAIHERHNPLENPRLADVAEQYAAALRHLDRPTDAEKWEKRAREIREKVAASEAKAKADMPTAAFHGFK
jgi:tetratricopeptide (TPR) repeat protein